MTDRYQRMKAPALLQLFQVKAWVRDHAHGDGAICPCCDQVVRVYKRGISSSSARWLIWLCKVFDEMVLKSPEMPVSEIWIDVRESPVRGGDYAKLRHWGLIQQKPRDISTVSKDSGLWQPTGKGVRFAGGQERIPRFCHIFNGAPLQFSEETISIGDIVGTKFSYEDLMKQSQTTAVVNGGA